MLSSLSGGADDCPSEGETLPPDEFLYAGRDRDGMRPTSLPASATRVRLAPPIVEVPPREFEGRTRLTEVLLNEGLSEIGTRAFAGCAALERIQFPSTLRGVGDGAFRDCPRLRWAGLNERLGRIEGGAFDGCPLLSEFQFPRLSSRLAALVPDAARAAFVGRMERIPGVEVRESDVCVSVEVLREEGGWAVFRDRLQPILERIDRYEEVMRERREAPPPSPSANDADAKDASSNGDEGEIEGGEGVSGEEGREDCDRSGLGSGPNRGTAKDTAGGEGGEDFIGRRGGGRILRSIRARFRSQLRQSELDSEPLGGTAKEASCNVDGEGEDDRASDAGGEGAEACNRSGIDSEPDGAPLPLEIPVAEPVIAWAPEPPEIPVAVPVIADTGRWGGGGRLRSIRSRLRARLSRSGIGSEPDGAPPLPENQVAAPVIEDISVDSWVVPVDAWDGPTMPLPTATVPVAPPLPAPAPTPAPPIDVREFVYKGEEEIPDDVTHLKFDPLITEVPARAFRSGKRLRDVIFNEGLVKIGDGAFEECRALLCVQFPSTLKEVGDNAFRSCNELGWDGLNLNEGLEKLGCRAFEGTSLQNIRFPSTLKEVCEDAFQNCLELGQMMLNEGLERIGPGALSCGNITFPRLSERVAAINPTAARAEILHQTMQIPRVEVREREVRIERSSCEASGWGNLPAPKDLFDSILKQMALYELREAAPVYELALWKRRMESEEGTTNDLDREAYRVWIPDIAKEAIVKYCLGEEWRG